MILINKYSRPGAKLHAVKALVVHQTEMPGKSADHVYSYFASTVVKKQIYASSQYILGLNAELVQVMPENEVAWHCGSGTADPVSKKVYTDKARELFGAYASNPNTSPNFVTVGIEVCQLDWAGKITEKMYNKLIDFAASFCVRYKLDPLKEVIRHIDVVGWKQCPRLWAENNVSWETFRHAVKSQMEKGTYPI
jgi:N-acetylmuramoyl-L-alanine amidase